MSTRANVPGPQRRVERCHDAVTAAGVSGEPGAPAMALHAPLNQSYGWESLPALKTLLPTL